MKSFPYGIAVLGALAACGGTANRPADSVCGSAAACLAFPRTEQVQSLAGAWQGSKTRDAALSEPASGWSPFDVPGIQWSEAAGGSDYFWFRRDVTIPEAWRGRRIYVRLVGARYDPHVFVDGKLIGHRLDGWTPYELEVSEALSGTGTHHLEVRCQDWGATFDSGFKLPNPIQGEARSAPKGKVLAPVGGHLAAYGPWEDVELVARAPTHVDDVAITTSFRKHEIHVEGTAVGDAGDLRVEALVLDGDQFALHLPAVTAASGARWALSAPFPNALPWSPESPHLYRLRVMLFTGKSKTPIDVHEETFGFRELWAQGPDFYLNGVKRHLLATSTWPNATPQKRQEVIAALTKIKEGGNVAFRLHTQPWARAWLEEADRLGLLIVEEGAMWCDGGGAYAYKDDRFWKNAADMLSGMVRRDRNHASLVMWSIENELLHCGAASFDPGVEKKLGDLGRGVKQLDPTHLITFEADHDPDGAADVIGLHYPHDAPDYWDYPNTADWLGQTVVTGTGGGLMGSSNTTFHWDRNKPLYIGEYLWCPSEDHSVGSIFFGPEVYRDRERYSELAKGRAWVDQTLAYRRAGVSGFCPWTAFDGGGKPNPTLFDVVKDVFTPVAEFVRERDQRFFSKETISRTVEVFNDGGAPVQVELAWELAGTGVQGKRSLSLEPGGYRAEKIDLALPDAKQPMRLELVTHLVNNDGKNGKDLKELKELHTTHTELWVEPKKALSAPAGVKFWVFDPKHAWTERAKAEGFSGAQLGALSELSKKNPAEDVVVIAPHAFAATGAAAASVPSVGADVPGAAEFGKFLADGGRILILEQDTYAGLPIGLSLVDHASTLTFPLDRSHPVLAGVSRSDLSMWRGDNYVTRREIQRPDHGGGRALVVSGGAHEIDQAPIVEKAMGSGRLLLVQALVGEKFAVDPTARRILQNALDALARPSVRGRTVVVSDEPALVPALTRLGVDFQDSASVPGDLRAGDLLVLGGGGARVKGSAAALAAFLKTIGNKATVYWHAPTLDAFDALARVLGGQGLGVEHGSGPLVGVADVSGPFASVCAEDFVFRGAARGSSWQKGFEPDPAVVHEVFTPRSAPGATTALKLDSLEGQYVSKTPDGGVLFATNGSAKAAVDVPEAGLYSVAVTADGTPVKGVLPTLRIGTQGSNSAEIPLTQKPPRAYAAILNLPKGKSMIEVAFVNDAAEGAEDRNLTVHRVELATKPWSASGVRLLTLPAAVVQLSPPSAPGATVIVDQVAWPGATSNQLRAGRYATSLLGALGARFTAPAGEPTWLGPRVFKLVTQSPYSEVTDSEIAFRTAGTVVGAFDAVRAGTYTVVLRARSDPAQKVWGHADISMDGKKIGSIDVAARETRDFDGPTVTLSGGRHELSIAFTNDVYVDGQDRNLYVSAVGLAQKR